MTFLLDVNVLIALIDPTHIGHDIAHRWFEREGKSAWATCPLTENGVVRIVSHPKYPNSSGSPSVVLESVSRLRRVPGHDFWPDDISLVETDIVDPNEIRTSAQVTDTYLLALAATHGGRLATLDRRLSTMAVRARKSALHVIDGR